MAGYKQMIEALDDAILALVQRKFEQVSVAGRSYRYADLDKLRAMRREYARLDRQSRRPAKLGVTRIVQGGPRR